MWIYLMTGHHTTGYGRIQNVVRVASKPERDMPGRDTGIQGGDDSIVIVKWA